MTRPDDPHTRRLHSYTYPDVVIGRIEPDNFVPAGHPGFKVDITIVHLWDSENQRPSNVVHEVVFRWKGDKGEHMGIILSDLAIATSRAIQRRDPSTGADVAEATHEIECTPTGT